MKTPLIPVHLLWVEVERSRQQRLLSALRAAGFEDVEITEWDTTQTWFRVALPEQDDLLEAAIDILLSVEGFSFEIQGAMHGPILAVVFRARPGRTTRARRLRRHSDRRALRAEAAERVSAAWAWPVRPRQALLARPAPPGGPVAGPGVPVARPRAVGRGRLGLAGRRLGDLLAERADASGFQPAAVWSPAARFASRVVENPRVSRVMAAVAPVAVVLAVMYQATLRRIFTGGPFPSSTDAMGHLYRVSYLAQEWRHGRLVPQWTPGWYMGTPLLEYYPPLATFVMAPLAALGDPALSYRVFVFAALALGGILTTVLFRTRLGAAGALTAGVTYGLAPFVLRTVFAGGSLPLALCVLIQPVLLRLMLDLYERPSARRFVFASLGCTAMVLAHNLQALMFFTATGVGFVVAGALFRRGAAGPARVVAAMLIGIALAGLWLLPAMTPLDIADTPNRGGVERPFAHSRDLSVMSPELRGRPQDTYLGLVLVTLGAAGAAAGFRRPIAAVLAAATGTAVFLMFGMKNPVVSAIPLLQQFVFFEWFLLTASLALALLAGLLVQVVGAWLAARPRLPAAGALAAIAVLVAGLADARPYFSLVRQTDHELWVTSSEALAEQAPPGRLADFIGRPELSYFPGTVGRDAVYGWSIEGTPHADSIRALGEAMGAGQTRFVDRQLRQWWIAGAYALPDDAAASRALEAAGFAPGPVVDAGTRVTPWTRQDFASIANMLKRNAVVVGRAHSHTAIVFPWVNQTRTGSYEELTDEVLLDNSVVILAEAPASMPEAAQGRLAAFQRRGGVVVALVGNDPSVWRAGLGLQRHRFSPTMAVVDPSGEILESPVEIRGFVVDRGPWEALAADDPRAQTVLAFRDESAAEFPLVSRMRTPDGPVYVIGGGVFAFGMSHPDQPLVRVIEEALRAEIPGLLLDHGLTPLPAAVENQSSGGMDIRLDGADGSGPVLLSVTYAPHWRSITVNGEPVRPRNHEGLILLDVPSGPALIELRQGPTTGLWIGAALSASGAVALGLALRTRPRRELPSLRAIWTRVRRAVATAGGFLASQRPFEILFGPASAPRDGAMRGDHITSPPGPGVGDGREHREPGEADPLAGPRPPE